MKFLFYLAIAASVWACVLGKRFDVSGFIQDSGWRSECCTFPGLGNKYIEETLVFNPEGYGHGITTIWTGNNCGSEKENVAATYSRTFQYTVPEKIDDDLFKLDELFVTKNVQIPTVEGVDIFNGLCPFATQKPWGIDAFDVLSSNCSRLFVSCQGNVMLTTVTLEGPDTAFFAPNSPGGSCDETSRGIANANCKYSRLGSGVSQLAVPSAFVLFTVGLFAAYAA